MITLMPDWEERCERLDKIPSYMRFLALQEVKPDSGEVLHLACKYDVPNVWEEEG